MHIYIYCTCMYNSVQVRERERERQRQFVNEFVKNVFYTHVRRSPVNMYKYILYIRTYVQYLITFDICYFVFLFQICSRNAYGDVPFQHALRHRNYAAALKLLEFITEVLPGKSHDFW